jgi:hypothetical protein
MSTGVLMFAHNNRTIDYGEIAMANACLIKRYMSNNNVTVITDQGTVDWLYKKYSKDFVDSKIDNVNIIRRRLTSNQKRYYDTSYTKKMEQFYNINRHSAYELSPYDETLLIDCDYLIGNNLLDQCWQLDYDLQINKTSKDIYSERGISQFKRISGTSVDFYWATVVFFRKNTETELFFNLIQHIYQNWPYYSMLYDFTTPNYRNDHAFSIAVHMFNGMQNTGMIKPLPLPYLQHIDGVDDFIDCENSNHFTFLLEKHKRPGDYIVCKTKDTNMHVMNKFALARLAGKIIEQNK